MENTIEVFVLLLFGLYVHRIFLLHVHNEISRGRGLCGFFHCFPESHEPLDVFIIGKCFFKKFCLFSSVFAD